MKKELSNYGMAAKLKLSMDKDDPDDLELTTECIKEQLLKRSHNHSLSDMDYRFYIKILWFGFIDEGYGFGSIVAFDRTTKKKKKDKYVELFHFERNEIILYDKSIVRLYRSSYHLTPASNRCLVYATLVRTSFGINFRPFLNMR